MEENKDINKLSPFAKKEFSMEPPANAWSLLDADLEKKRAIIYRRRGNRFKMLSITLALLLIGFIGYDYLTPQHGDMAANVATVSAPVSDKSIGSSVVAESPGSKPAAADAHETASPPEANASQNLQQRATVIPAPITSHPAQKSTGLLPSSVKPAGEPSTKVFATGRQHDESVNTGENNTSSSDEKNNLAEVNETPANPTPAEKEKVMTDGSVDSAQGLPLQPEENAEKQIVVAEKTAVRDSTPVPTIRDSAADKQNNRSRFSLAAFYSPEYPGNRFTENKPGFPDAIARYHEREKAQLSFNAGVLVRYDVSKRWSIATGASYSTLVYETTLPTVFARHGSDDAVHYMYPTSCGVIEIPNDGTVLQNGDSMVGPAFCDQTVKFINVPMLVRFQAGHGRFTFYSNAGISASFVLEEVATVSKGDYGVNITNHITGLKKMHYRYLFGLGSEYHFKNRMSISLEPAFRGSITSLTEHILLNCYPYSFGVNTGVSYHF